VRAEQAAGRLRKRRARGGRLRVWIKRAALGAACLVALLVVPPGLFIGIRCYSQRATETTQGSRDESSTYLTLPEWYIVYSTEEYASFIGREAPSGFPYFRSIGQYWSYYGSMCDATKGRYLFNPKTHGMLGVIGVSFSIENGLKGIYENTIGRATEWLGSHDVEEDEFAYRTATEYGRFMHTIPWYEFPFGARLAALWRETSLWGSHPIRKWERKAELTLEYGLKAIYSRLIGGGLHTVYAPEELQIQAWVEDAPDSIFADPAIRKVSDRGPHSYAVMIPRYEAFTVAALTLIGSGARFRDIAGNDEILVTGIAPLGFDEKLPEGRLLFHRPILTMPGFERVAVSAPVGSLHTVLRDLRDRDVRIEHLYDY
jgi:hypothetical protein